MRIGAIAGHVGKNQWQLEFHPPKKVFVDGCRFVRSEEPPQHDRVVITARSVIEAIASAQPYRSRSAKLDKLYENRPRIFDGFVGFEVCHGGLPMQAIHVLKSSVARLNEEATNNSFPNRAKWRMTSTCGCGWSRRVFRFSMPQVIPAGLAPRWAQTQRGQTHRFE